MNNVTVSVIMPVYNASLHLKEAVESILSQTYKDFELIIINDGSVDESMLVLGQFQDTRMKIIDLTENKGIIHALNCGIDKAQGKYIARMDSDDIALSTRFEQQVQYLNAHPDIDFLGTLVESFNSHTAFKSKKPFTSNEEIKASLFFSTTLTHPSMMIRRCVFDTLRYNEAYKYAEDYGLWVEALTQHRFYVLPQVLLRYRLSETGITLQAEKNTEERMRYISKIIQIHFDRLGIQPTPEWIQLQFELGMNSRIINAPKYDYKKVREYFDFVQNKNKQVNLFEPKAFSKILAKKWLTLILLKRPLDMRWYLSPYFWIGLKLLF